jgi:hypothetical protein
VVLCSRIGFSRISQITQIRNQHVFRAICEIREKSYANDSLNFNAFDYEKPAFGRKFAILFSGPEVVRQDFLPDILKTNLLTPHMSKENIAYSPDISGSDPCKNRMYCGQVIGQK